VDGREVVFRDPGLMLVGESSEAVARTTALSGPSLHVSLLEYAVTDDGVVG